MHKYYVYRHVRKDLNQPFYIGKGAISSKKNNPYHRAKSHFRRNPIWHEIVAKTSFVVHIMFTTDDEQEAFSKEREFIQLYGRVRFGTGLLCNIGAGGGGGASIPHLPEWSRDRFKPCYRYDIDGNYLSSHESIRSASRLFEVMPTSIRRCIKGKLKTAGGFQWTSSKLEKLDKVFYPRFPNMRVGHGNKKTKNMQRLPVTKSDLEKSQGQEILSELLV